MLKSYVVFEKGLVETLIFYLKDCLTFGRGPENDIQTSDPKTSDFHAEIRLEDGRAVVEDLGSQVGTFLNGEKTRKAILSHNDQVQIGDMVFRFIQEEVLQTSPETAPDARSAEAPAGYRQTKPALARSSSRVSEAVSNIPLFSGLDPDGMSEVIQQARLLVFDADQMVFHQGDAGKSLYIVLDGKVRVFLQGLKGESVPLAVLSENQFFGEISFLTGQPRSASVQAMENTLLCEIGADALREITYRWPAIKNVLNRYYQQRMADTAEKKRKAGIHELRGAPRYNITVPVSFALDATAIAPDMFKNTVYRFLSKDISASGVRIRLNNRKLARAAVGCKLSLELVLPMPWKTIHCRGIAVNASEDKSKPAYGYLHVAFRDLEPESRKKLEDFLAH